MYAAFAWPSSFHAFYLFFFCYLFFHCLANTLSVWAINIEMLEIFILLVLCTQVQKCGIPLKSKLLYLHWRTGSNPCVVKLERRADSVYLCVSPNTSIPIHSGTIHGYTKNILNTGRYNWPNRKRVAITFLDHGIVETNYSNYTNRLWTFMFNCVQRYIVIYICGGRIGLRDPVWSFFKYLSEVSDILFIKIFGQD